MLTPPFIAPTRFDDADAALAQVRRIFDTSIGHLREALTRFVAGQVPERHVRACYPFVRVHTATVARAPSNVTSTSTAAWRSPKSPPSSSERRQKKPT